MKKNILIYLILILIFGWGIMAYKGLKTSPQKTDTTGEITGSPTSKPEESNPTGQTTAQKNTNEISLTVSQPQNNAVVSTPTIQVTGKTLPGIDVSINEKDVKADSQGNFSASLSLDEGDNIVSVLAVDQNGNSSEKELTVTLNSGPQTE